MKKCLIFFCLFPLFVFAQRRTFLDNFIGPFRIFKSISSRFLIRDVNSRENRRNLKFNDKLQTYIDESVPFPCNINNTRSEKRPTSVHKLRPGDIDVVGAIGDSLTAGYGLLATNPLQVLLENRGISFSIGGEGTWRQFLTIPNILKMFNPKIIGYSLKTSITIERASQFNVAEGGAISEEMPYMSKILLKRIVKDPRVDLKNDWKMINVLIGANNFCSELCYLKDAESALAKHKEDMLTVLRIFRDNLPRTIVNLIPPPHLRILANFSNKSPICETVHHVECPCLFGLIYQHRLENLFNIMTRWQLLDMELANLPEFDLDDFTVVYQPFVLNYTFPLTQMGYTDYSFMSADCFHFSQKGNARVANSLWNNMLEPVGAKSLDGNDILAKFNCPTEEHPYIYTRRNS